MGTGEKPILATFATDLSIPTRFRREGEDELKLLGLHREGSRLQNGCFGFETKHPSDLVVEMEDVEAQLAQLLGGAWLPCGPFMGNPADPLSPIEIMEIVSSSPLRRMELKEIRKGGHRFDAANAEQKARFEEWFRCYSAALSNSPLGRPALEARARVASLKNREAPHSVSPDQFRALIGVRIFEQLKDKRVGLITF